MPGTGLDPCSETGSGSRSRIGTAKIKNPFTCCEVFKEFISSEFLVFGIQYKDLLVNIIIRGRTLLEFISSFPWKRVQLFFFFS
ncbi:unnamed protein product [Meloidogyne enterolobii]|uniref:Uncharacterized protein n=1 Tax=Meloidogyne enterolobii TaxID=390850 RepID=A0ACB0Z3S9_MELEN